MNNSSVVVMNALVESGLPVFCFPEMIDKMPMSLTYCFLYLLGCAMTMAVGFYVYYKKKLEYKLKNGHRYDRQDSKEQPSDQTVLPRLLRRRSNSPKEVYQKVTVSDGGK